MYVREDFRRDGLVANFLADSELINIVSSILKGSKINIGYPAICDQEYQICSDILKNSNNKAELCVVGHAREEHLKKMADITKDKDNVSANSWMPISDYFLDQTVKVSSKEAFEGLKSIIKKWKVLSNNPFDMAFADCTSYEEKLPSRIVEWTDYCLNNGVRNIIICDTRGIGTENQIEYIFKKLSSFGNRIEYHPHNDNGNALKNIDIVLKQGVETIGTAFYNAGERLTMIDPISLIDKGLFFNKDYFPEFEEAYAKKIGSPKEVLNSIYGKNIIITGSQYKLRARDISLEMKFEVTTDTHIASKMLDKTIDKNSLAEIKDEFLYKRKKLFLDSERLIEAYKGVLK